MTMEVKGITIHNTGTELSARENYENLLSIGKPNLCHFLVDENEIIESWDLNIPSSHTGKGYDFGNLNTISIEICRSTSSKELYLKAQERAVILILNLLNEYRLTVNDIYFHMDFDPQFRCPHRILEIYKTKETFIREVIERRKYGTSSNG